MMDTDPQILVVEIEPGPPEYGPPKPGQKLDNFLALQLPKGSRVIMTCDIGEYPATFYGMQPTDITVSGYGAYIYLNEPIQGERGWIVPSWWLRVAEDK